MSYCLGCHKKKNKEGEKGVAKRIRRALSSEKLFPQIFLGDRREGRKLICTFRRKEIFVLSDCKKLPTHLGRFVKIHYGNKGSLFLCHMLCRNEKEIGVSGFAFSYHISLIFAHLIRVSRDSVPTHVSRGPS